MLIRGPTLTVQLLRRIVAATEGGHLDDLAPKTHVYDLEATPDNAGIAKQLSHFLRGGIRGNIEVLGLVTQQQVAHTPADQVALITRLEQHLHDFDGGVTDALAGHIVLITGYDVGSPHRRFTTSRGQASQPL